MSYRKNTQEKASNFQPGEAQENPWKVKERQYRKLIEDYIAGFRYSNIWLEALTEGWDLDLWRYVHSIASVQSAMITGSSVGWSGGDIFGYAIAITDIEKKIFLDNQNRQAQTGTINVAIPTGKISNWKKYATEIKQKLIESQHSVEAV